MFGHNEMMWGFEWWGMAFFWILVIVGIVILVKWPGEQRKRSQKGHEGGETALDILKKRYAEGEIDQKEFEQKKKDLIS